MERIGVYLGEKFPPNLVRLLSGIDALADDRFKFVAIGSEINKAKLPGRFEYYDVPEMRGARGLTRMLTAYRSVDRYLQETTERPDAILQITAPHFHAVPVLLAGRRHGVSVATRIPGNKFDEFREQSDMVTTFKTYLMNNVFLHAIRFSSAVVVLSEYNRSRVADLGIPDRSLYLLRQPLNTEQFGPPRGSKDKLKIRLGFNQDAYSVLYVGRLSKLKGIKDLEKVVAEFEGTGNHEFHFVGTGTLKAQLEAYNNTVCHGFVDPMKLHEFYKAADIYVHPSYIEEQGISWTMIEAAATGLPVIARDYENADHIASFVFTKHSDLKTHLKVPTEWKPAKYPEEWSLDHLKPKYNAFFKELVKSNH